MGKVIFTLIFIFSFNAFAFGQKCEEKISILESELGKLEAKLNGGERKNINLIEAHEENVDLINRYINSLGSCLETSTMKTIQYRWNRLKGDLNRKYIFKSSIRNISNKYSGFFELIRNLEPYSQEVKKDMVKQIDSLVKRNLNDSLLPVKKSIESTGDSIKRLSAEVVDLSKETEQVKTETVSIKERVVGIDSMLKYHVVQHKNYVTSGAFSDGLFSLSYSRIFYKSKELLFPPTWSAEVLFPVNSQSIRHVGAFGLGGFYHKRFAFQAGIGYLQIREYHNISWKGNIDFLGDRVGFGIAFSPITGTGIRASLLFGK